MPAALHVNWDHGYLKPFSLLPVLSVTPTLTEPPMLFARRPEQQQPRANNAQMFSPVTFAHYDSQPCKAQPHTEVNAFQHERDEPQQTDNSIHPYVDLDISSSEASSPERRERRSARARITPYQKNQSVKRCKCTVASRSRGDPSLQRRVQLARTAASLAHASPPLFPFSPLRRGAHARALPLAIKLRLQGRGRKLCAAARRSRPLLLALVSRPHPNSDEIPARARGMRVHSAAPRLPYKLTATKRKNEY
ncbi:hypothetical protein SRHO_G00067040 [Serrasalmus rhombeus]